MENEKFLDVVYEFFILPTETVESELVSLGVDKYPYEIVRKSIDARKGIRIFYRVKVTLPKEMAKNLLDEKKVSLPSTIIDIDPLKNVNNNNKVLVVGAGPSGLFAAYYLLLSGVKVVLIDQGKKVEDRSVDIATFFNKRELNEYSNIQNGEGGAGTYSDGKIGTRVKSPIKTWIYKKLVEFGAPEEIMYLSKPHIGTDKLKQVIINFRKKLLSLGCEIHYSTELVDIKIENNILKGVTLYNHQNFETRTEEFSTVFLGVGNSSRKLFETLKEKNVAMELKAIAVGYRIVHPQVTIDRNQYGATFQKYNLPASDYALTSKVGNDNVYSFCMCPGGHIVNSTSELNSCVTNGMSNYNRDSSFANSAVVVNIDPEYFSNDIEKCIDFQRIIERRGFEVGGSNYDLPAMSFANFIGRKIPNASVPFQKNAVLPTYVLKKNIKNIYEDYDFINKSISKSLSFWDKKIKKWGDDGLLVVGPETRTSSPVRILRDDKCMSTNTIGLYPIGEGAGYAGGITSSAIDGVKAAMEFCKII